MTLTVTVEDGSGVLNANSYVAVADLRNYAAMRGIALPADDDACAVLLFQAMDLIATYAAQFPGMPSYQPPTYTPQALDWPRQFVADMNDPCGAMYPINYMPPKLIEAQCAAACAANSQPLQPVVGLTGFVTSEKVGPITTNYEYIPGTPIAPIIPQFVAAIAQITRPTGGLPTFRA